MSRLYEKGQNAGEAEDCNQAPDKKFLKLVGREEKTTWHQQKNSNSMAI